MRVGLHVNGTAPWQSSVELFRGAKYSRVAYYFLDTSCRLFQFLSINKEGTASCASPIARWLSSY